MNELVYPRERTLGAITLVLGVIVWIGLVVGTFGGALLALLLGFLLYLFAQSALISHIKGNGVELSASQFPELHAQFLACCEKLGMKQVPRAYVLNGNGGLNAFATRFLGAQYVVLLSDVVDAMERHPDGLRFYIGHELGHLRMKHIQGHLLRWPVLWLPLLGAAYSRARESTCDRHGLACSGSPQGAAQALAALSAGAGQWDKVDMASYVGQVKATSGFWMSFHELVAGYPWLSKRAARVVDTGRAMPRRHPLAYLFAVFVPYAGRLGGGFGLIVMVYLVAVLAAVALPAYQDYTVRAKVTESLALAKPAQEALAGYYQANGSVPESLEQAGVEDRLPNGRPLSLDPSNMVLSVSLEHGELLLTPEAMPDGEVRWHCEAGEGLAEKHLPTSCR